MKWADIGPEEGKLGHDGRGVSIDPRSDEGLAGFEPTLFTLKTALGPEPTRKKVNKLLRRLLSERAQTVEERMFNYPSGNQGDDLIALNSDNHRFIMVSQGCGPQDYVLKATAQKSEPAAWVSILDGELAAVPSMGMPQIFFASMSQHVVYSFLNIFDIWKDEVSPYTPADQCLAFCGSTAYTQGMIVAESYLNALKKNTFGFERPIVPGEWSDCCLNPTWSSAENAFGFIQEAMAVFDYYEHTDVKARHQWAYG
ncbi:hypothetical protein BKA67DRAFT_657756 [Truncatella angustata]|uniref:Uncharacterized protein n=1 Tax=Truncatella angustata TaxID=152316 RepID=A0A9P8UPJ5_9PEZI|nr:uncharacterized protein BKA67DRAFT_657756 [Truncatella angustata]KAH6655850.1 hypothetical protein BKA67DRAFT_657756 [Truncatella angustata]